MEPLACQNTLSTQLAERAQPTQQQLADDNTVALTAGELEAQIGDQPTASMTGGVLLRRGDRLAGVDSAIFDADERALHLNGNRK